MNSCREAALATLHRVSSPAVTRNIVRSLAGHQVEEPGDLLRIADWFVNSQEYEGLRHELSDHDQIRGLQQKLVREGIRVVALGDPDYPSSLLDLRQPPPILYVRGQLPRTKRVGVGICGSRHASDKGLRFAYRFGSILADLGIPEVSGYARGVDTRAHLGALESEGRTVVVLAEGILRFRVKKEFHQVHGLDDRMGVLSQFSPAKPWHAGRAMERNKVICGLSRALVVVEAGATGGTLDAGRECLRQKKPLLVIHYETPREMPDGNSQLIAEGGIPIRSVAELETQINDLWSAEFQARDGPGLSS